MYKINMIHSRTPPKTQALVAISSIRSEGKGELRKEGLVENLFRKHLDSQISSSFYEAGPSPSSTHRNLVYS